MQGVNVYIADDHNIVAQGIASLLKQTSLVAQVTIFKNGQDLFKHCAIQIPHIVFLDLEMPGWDGRKTLVEIKKNYPAVLCYMLSMLNEKFIIEDCIKKGASGYLNKDCSLQELSEAIESPAGEVYYSKEVLKILSGIHQPTGVFTLSEPLSERESEVLGLLCKGLSPKEIAGKLFLSIRTIETHKTNIMQKFDVGTVDKLISLAIKNKVV